MLLDPSTGVTVLACLDLVRMLGGEPGVQQELMRFQVETGTRVCTGLDGLGRELVRLRRLAAAAAATWAAALVASGVAPHRYARAGRGTASPVTRSWPAGTARWWPRPAPAPATFTSGSPPGTWASRSWPGCGPGSRRCSPSPPTPRSPTGTIPDGPAGGTRSNHAGRPRCRPRRGRTPPPTTPQSAASSGAARRWTSGTSTSWPGFPRATRPSRSGSPTSALTPAPPSCGGADPRPGRHRPGRGPPRDADGNGAGRQVAAALAAAARQGLAGTGADPLTGQAVDAPRPRPASSIMSAPRSTTTATPRRSPGCCAGLITGGPEPTASEPCSPAPHPPARSSRRSPARRCPATSRAAGGPTPSPGGGGRTVGV